MTFVSHGMVTLRFERQLIFFLPKRLGSLIELCENHTMQHSISSPKCQIILPHEIRRVIQNSQDPLSIFQVGLGMRLVMVWNETSDGLGMRLVIVWNETCDGLGMRLVASNPM